MSTGHAAGGVSAPWAELPADALGEIAGHLHDAGDLVRFRAACRPWREAPQPPSSAPPRFLPWLLESYVSPDEDPDTRVGVLLHSPFSTRTTRHLLPISAVRAMEIHAADVSSGRVLAASYSNDAGVTAALVNPLDGGATSALPPLPQSAGPDSQWWCASGVVSSSGAVVFHTGDRCDWAAMKLRPAGGWEEADVTCRAGLEETTWLHRDRRRAAALWASAALPGVACGIKVLPPLCHWCDRYVIEFRGEMLWVDMDVPRRYDPAPGSAGPESVSVRVYTMQEARDSGRHQWVERGPDHLCFFLGLAGSFVVDAREFAGSTVVLGGCAYFFCWHPKWTESEHITGVYRCCLRTGTATVVAELPRFLLVPMWFMPRPRVSPLLPRVSADFGGQPFTKNIYM
ncbi:unnamed protein product [Urochloa decumbens]|uniref:KIB1-4 beta-propeller domain-containing protein n=1 Tax=Urochloa decumbens TaxID=240449 RepID=A0ABC8Y7C4_9POAL